MILWFECCRFSVIHYLSDRLVWQDTSYSVRIGDAVENYTAAVKSVEDSVSMVMVMHDSLHRYPGLLFSLDIPILVLCSFTRILYNLLAVSSILSISD